MRSLPLAPVLLAPLALLSLAVPGACAQASGDAVTQEELEAWTEEIKANVEALREAEFPRPVSVAVADAAKLREYMQVRMEKDTSPEEMREDETVAKLLGLVASDLDLLATNQALIESQVGGFYDPDTEGFYLMDSMGGGIARTILAHELTHALDDQLYDIDGTLEKLADNTDAQVAYQAVVEGSGTAVMNQWTFAHMGELSKEEMESAGSMGMEGLDEAPPYLWKPLLAVYLKGAAFLNRTSSVLQAQLATPDLADYHTAFTSPPRSTEQVLHPKKYWGEETDEPVPVRLDVSSLPEGWTVAREDTLGELGLGLFVEPLEKRGGVTSPLAMLGTRYTYPASEGWGGDRYVLLARGDARLLLLETVWDTAADSAEFRVRLQELEPHLTTAALGTAEAKGLSGHGNANGVHEGSGGVWFLSWIGCTADEAQAARESVRVSAGE